MHRHAHISVALSVFVLVATLFALVTPALAATYTCTGVNGETPTTTSSVNFNTATKTCTVDDSSTTNTVGYVNFQAYIYSANSTYTHAFGKGVGPVSSLTLHDTATIAGTTYANGVSASKSVTTNGATTSSATWTVDGTAYTMTVSVTVASNGASFDITSAKVTTPDPSTTTPTPRAPQAAISRSQTNVVVTNIGTRLNAIGSPVGVSRVAPGVGRDTPGGTGRTTPGAGRTAPQGSNPANFTPAGSALWSLEKGGQSNSQGIGMRDLAMLASFDTSAIVLGAAGVGDDTAPPLHPQERADLLARSPITFWGHGSYTNVDNTRNRSGDDSRYDGDVWGYNIGGDYQFDPQFYAGASLGYSKTNLTTTYNTGTYDEDTWTFTPYAVYTVDGRIKVSALAGYAVSNVDQTRSSSSITGSTDSKMAYAALNGSYKVQPDPELPLDLKAQVSLLATHKKVDAYSESDGTAVAASTSNTRQVKPGVEAAYTFDQGATVIQPFVKGAFVYDFKDPTNNDAGAYDVGGGVRLGNGATGLNGLIEGQTQLGRSDYKEYSFSAMVSYSFSLDGQGGTSLGLVTPYVKSDFTSGAQVYATGVGYNDKSGWLSLKFDVTQTLPTDALAESATDAMARAELRF